MKVASLALLAVTAPAFLARASNAKDARSVLDEIQARKAARKTKQGGNVGGQRGSDAARALQEDAGALPDGDLSMAEMGWGGAPPAHPMYDPKACPAPGGPVDGWGGPPPPPESEWGGPPHPPPPSHPMWPWGRRTQWKSKSKQSKKSGPKPDGTKAETCAPPVGKTCNGYSMYKFGAVDIEGSPAGPAPVAATWAELAALGGKDEAVYAFPGPRLFDLEGPQGTLEGCTLAPIPSMEEFENLNYELYRIAVNLAIVAGSADPPKNARRFLDRNLFALGVVKRATDVIKDNDGGGSRDGWVNLDGTPADVCMAGMWAENQPDNDSNFSDPNDPPETRLFLKGGKLEDRADVPQSAWGLYKCCVPTLTFSECGATA